MGTKTDKNNKKPKKNKKKQESQSTPEVQQPQELTASSTPQASKYLSMDQLIEVEHKISKIINSFNYEKVQKAMGAVDWHWANPGTPDPGKSVPTIERMKATSRYLLSKAATTPERIWCTGGFTAQRYDDGELSLHFYMAEAYSHED